MITFENVSKSFGSVKVLKDINLTIGECETFCLLGNSGSGKTTLLKLINKLIVSDSGKISINGKSIDQSDEKSLRQNMGYVIQSGGLFPHMTVGANIGLPLKLQKKSRKEINERTKELILQIGLDETFLNRYPSTLSGGQRQRVGIARAIVDQPDLLLLDEPFSALDPVLREQMQNDFLKMSFLSSVTKVMVTHDLKEAVKLGDKICLLEHGEVIYTGSPKEFLSTNHPVVKRYIGNEKLNLLIADIRVNDLTIANSSPDFLPEEDSYRLADETLTVPEALNSPEELFFDPDNQRYFTKESIKNAFIYHLKNIL